MPELNGSSSPVLSIRKLVTEFSTAEGWVRAVDGVSYDLYPGEVLGVVGESGSGKSVTVMSVMGLIPRPPGRIASGEVTYRGQDLLRMSRRQLNRIRGNEIAMVFQDPMSYLNPLMTIGRQISEAITTHHPSVTRADAMNRAVELLDRVGLPNAAGRAHQYPHEFSGGMRQRAIIAMAIANEPKVLIADEPTTALDVTIQAQVLDVLRAAKEAAGASAILITHDLGVIAEMADRVIVMYAGRVVESGPVHQIFDTPSHPYTVGLLASSPRYADTTGALTPIPGQPPSLARLPTGCAFHPRCVLGRDRQLCQSQAPPLEPSAPGMMAACHYSDEVLAGAARPVGTSEGHS